MKLCFLASSGQLLAEVNVSAEQWAGLKLRARRARLKVVDYILRLIEDYLDKLE